MTKHLNRRLLVGLSFIICQLSFGVVLTSCSSDDDNETPVTPTEQETPSEKELEQGNDQRPNWQSPNYDAFEMTMSVEIRLQDTLQAYASSQDLLCATINGEVRGVGLPKQVGEEWVFPLTVGSNDGSIAMSLSYYCDRLHRIFTTPWTRFDASAMPMGVGGIYEPTFVE